MASISTLKINSYFFMGLLFLLFALFGILIQHGINKVFPESDEKAKEKKEEPPKIEEAAEPE